MRELELGRGDEKQLAAWRELEWRRCLTSPAYFVQKYGRLIDKSGNVIPFDLWPVQAELLHLWYTRESTIAVKSRQLGITTLSIHFALWDVLFHEAAQWFVVSASETAAKDAMRRLRATIANLPEWMVTRAQERSGEAVTAQSKRASNSTIAFRAGMSALEVLTSTTKSVAGRSGNFIFDEFSRHENQEEIYQLALPAFDGGGMAIIIANGNGEDFFYSLFWASKEQRTRFVAHFFDWRCDPNRDEAWYERMKRDYLIQNPEADEFGFKAQYPANEQEAFYLSGRSRFPAVWVNLHAQSAREEGIKPEVGFLEKPEREVRFQHFVNGNLTVWEMPEKGKHYAIGVDPAGGKQDGNWSVAEVVRIDSSECGVQVAEYRAKVEPVHLAAVIERLGRFYNDAFMVVLRNNHGHAVIASIKDTYFNLYKHIVESKTFSDDYNDTIGYPETPKTKPEMIDGLAAFLDHGTFDEPHEPQLRLRSPFLINELSRYEIKDNGSTGAPKGQTDDCVSAIGAAVIGIKTANIRAKQTKNVLLMPWQF